MDEFPPVQFPHQARRHFQPPKIIAHRGSESGPLPISPRRHRWSLTLNPPTMNLEDLKNTVSNITVLLSL